MTKKIGILCAGDTEFEPFLQYMENIKTTKKAMLTFYEGTINGCPVAALFSGVCKVNAAVAAQLLIEVFQVDAIINAGTAGGMSQEGKLFDTVVTEKAAYHDVAEDILTEFHPWLPEIYFPSDKQLLAAARSYAEKTEHRIFFGKTVTGEQFIEDEKREEINAVFSPLSVDMETAAIAHVCYVSQIPFLAVRTITDTPEHMGIENFDKNCEQASAISAEITVGILRTYICIF